jgi:hypothetical protein
MNRLEFQKTTRRYAKMQRRQFLKTTGAVVITASVPMSLPAEEYKYPLIGQPYVTGLFRNRVFEDLVKHQIAEGKVHSIRTSLNYTEAIVMKNPYSMTNVLQSMPKMFIEAAYTIVDMETFTILKSRAPFKTKYLEIPDGANVELVIKNRRGIR